MRTSEPIDLQEIFWQFVWLGVLYPVGLFFLWKKLTKR